MADHHGVPKDHTLAVGNILLEALGIPYDVNSEPK